jgi:ATP/maltotriose-dependent transcriptional regulator MalT
MRGSSLEQHHEIRLLALQPAEIWHLDASNGGARIKEARSSIFCGQSAVGCPPYGAKQLWHRDNHTITGREREILAMISQGFSNKRIARTLEISPETVKSHVKHIFLKLAVSTRTEAVFRAITVELL